ncbi:RNA polymerase sigma factor [Streptomyces sp. NPDC014684]|uniref:RNA polymerase sigma factor n=1 Tax=Streptomyces sp. NPDC014684 TaxID=3364880 RepID=UPI0036F542E4
MTALWPGSEVLAAGAATVTGPWSDDLLAQGFAEGDEACLTEAYRRWGALLFTIAFRRLGDSEEAKDVTQQVFVGAWRGRQDFDHDRGELVQLPAPQQTVLRMAFYDDLSQSQIAVRTGMPLGRRSPRTSDSSSHPRSCGPGSRPNSPSRERLPALSPQSAKHLVRSPRRRKSASTLPPSAVRPPHEQRVGRCFRAERASVSSWPRARHCSPPRRGVRSRGG